MTPGPGLETHADALVDMIADCPCCQYPMDAAFVLAGLKVLCLRCASRIAVDSPTPHRASTRFR